MWQGVEVEGYWSLTLYLERLDLACGEADQAPICRYYWSGTHMKMGYWSSEGGVDGTFGCHLTLRNWGAWKAFLVAVVWVEGPQELAASFHCWPLEGWAHLSAM
jgi:hypothetical protein